MAIKLNKKTLNDSNWTVYTNSYNEACELLIGRAGTVAFLKATEEVERPYKKLIAKDRLNSEKRRELNIMIIANSILNDWKGICDDEGNELSYSPELGVQLMNNDPELMEFVMDYALDSANFNVTEEAIVKKSTRPSNGK